MKDADYWIEKLGLVKHPEGGYYREVYRSSEIIPLDALPARYNGERSFSTSIYFLLREKETSRLHRLKSDELWHFYTGSPLNIHVIDPDGNHLAIKLGSDFEKGESFQYTIEKGCWFGATVNDPSSYSLAGCTVAPGFEFDDFEIGQREELIRLYPEHKLVIEMLAK